MSVVQIVRKNGCAKATFLYDKVTICKGYVNIFPEIIRKN